MIRIKAKTAGFRRCGVAHPAAATEYPDERFTPAELLRLQAEPELLVEVIAEVTNTTVKDESLEAQGDSAGGGEDGTAQDAPGQPQSNDPADAPATPDSSLAEPVGKPKAKK